MFIYEKDGQLRFDFDNDGTTDLTLKLNNSNKAVLDPTLSSTAACDITSFKIDDAVGTIGEGTIAVTVPSDTVVTALAPTIVVSTHATVSPASGTAKDFTNPVTYTVTAADGTHTKAYVVTVTVAQ